MDICACASAEKLSQRPSVTLSMDDLVFDSLAVTPGELVLARSRVNCAFNTSMEIGVGVTAENLQTGERRKLCGAYFTFVALGEDKKKCKIPKMASKTDADLRRAAEARERRQLRFRRKEIITETALLAQSRRGTGVAAADSSRLDGKAQIEKEDEDDGEDGDYEDDDDDDDDDYDLGTPGLGARMLEIVLPQHANHMGNTFGGQVMAWMDKAATVASWRHAQTQAGDASGQLPDSIRAVGIDDVFFLGPSTVGDRISIKASVNRCFGSFMEVGIV